MRFSRMEVMVETLPSGRGMAQMLWIIFTAAMAQCPCREVRVRVSGLEFRV